MGCKHLNMCVPNPFDHDPYKSAVVGGASPPVISQVAEGHVHVAFQSIKSIGVENVLDVESHHVNTFLNSKSHVIKYRNGGELAFSYSAKGDLIDLNANGLKLFITKNNELMFSIDPNWVKSFK